MGKDVNNIELWNGQLLELLTSDNKSFFTQIVRNEPDLLIQRPVTREGTPMIIENGMSVTVYFHEDSQGLCTFETEIYQHENIRIKINKPAVNTIKKAQRREFFRVPVAVEMSLVLSPNENSKEVKDIKVLTHDIGGGGISFLYPQKFFEVEDLVEGTLFLKTNTDQKEVAFNGKVVYAMKQQNQFYKIALQFVGMKELVRTDIIKFCMLKQVEIRKKVGNGY